MGEEEWAKKASRMKGDQRMPIGKGGPKREETHSSNLERHCYRRESEKWKNTEERRKTEREDNEASFN